MEVVSRLKNPSNMTSPVTTTILCAGAIYVTTLLSLDDHQTNQKLVLRRCEGLVHDISTNRRLILSTNY